MFTGKKLYYMVGTTTLLYISINVYIYRQKYILSQKNK